MLSQESVEHFLAMSTFYFMTTGKCATSVSVSELEDLICAINGDDEEAWRHADQWDSSLDRH